MYCIVAVAVEEPGHWRVGMAGSDDETVEVGMALFGAAADFPVPPCAAEAEEPEAADGNSAKRPRPSTSPVWADYEKLFKTVNRKTVRYGARCLHCSKEYSAYSSGGTGHLSCHIAVCVKKHEMTTVLCALVLNLFD